MSTKKIKKTQKILMSTKTQNFAQVRIYRELALTTGGQGSILQNSISAGNFLDQFSSSYFRQVFTKNNIHKFI
jgi:hypothetical protein